MAGRAIDLWVDFKLFGPLRVVFFRVVHFEIQLSHEVRVADVTLRVAVAIETPLHRHRLDLSYDFHLVNATVAGNATDALVDVSTVIEVNKVRQIMNSLPRHRIAGFQALANKFKVWVFCMNDAQRSPVGCRSVSTVAVATRCCRRHRSVTGFLNRVVTIAAVHLQLARVQFVTKRNGLFRLVTNVHDRRMDRREQARGQITTDRQSGDGGQSSKFVNPSGKVELLHRESPEFRGYEIRPLKLRKPA